MTEHTKDADDLQKLLDEATPGPWWHEPKETRRNGPDGQPRTDLHRIVRSEEPGTSICRAHIPGSGSEDEASANARLIAMAPDLAAALILAKEALAALVDEYCDYAAINHLGDPERQHNIKLARAALDAINALEPPK